MSITPDSSVSAFRDEARTILALSGGVNAVSMGKIRHRAQAAGLSPEQVESIVLEIRQGERPDTRNHDAFRKSARAILKKTRLKPGDLLTPRLSQKLVETAVARFKLSRADASEIVRDLAREFDLKRLSPEAAEAAFRQQVQTARASGPLSPSRLKSLRAFASSLGIDPSEFDTIVRDEVRVALPHPVEIRKGNRRFLFSVISAGVLALLGFFLFMSFFETHHHPRIPTTTSENTTTKPLPAPPKPAHRSSKNTVLATARRLFTAPADHAILDGLASSLEADRLGAMRSLLLRLESHRQTPEQARVLRNLLASFLASDSSSLTIMTLSNLRNRLTPFSSPQSLSPSALDDAFWTLDVLLDALTQPDIAPVRARTLASELDQALGSKSSAALFEAGAENAPEEARKLRALFILHAYDQLAQAALRQHSRGPFASAENTLFDQAATSLTPPQKLHERSAFLASVLDASGSAFDQYLPAITQILDQGSFQDVQNLTNVFLNTANAPLRDALEQQLRQRLPNSADISQPADLVSAFTLQAGGTGRRRSVVEQRARSALNQAKNQNSQSASETMQQVVELLRASTLACALDQGEAGSLTFDTILKDPDTDPGNNPSATAPTPPARRPATFFRGNLPPAAASNAGLDQILAELRSGNGFERVRAARDLAQTSLPDDLPEHQAQAIAAYLLWGGKSTQEDASVGPALGTLTKPPAVKLAMADLLGEVRRPPRNFHFLDASASERLLMAITGSPVTLDHSSWRDQTRRILLSLVLADLDPGLDSAVEHYRSLYQTQGRLLGLPDSETLLTARPSQMVEVVTNHLASELAKNPDRLPEPDRLRLARLPDEITAADYAASAEPQRLVLLQRVWLKTLSLLVASRKPALAESARALSESAPSSAAPDDDLLEQLRDGEQRALRLWLLLIQTDK